MTLNKQEKYLIITPKEYKKVLYNFKENHPYYDFKVISKSELLDLLSFSYQKDPIPYLLSFKKWDYSTIKKLLNILRIGNFTSIKEFNEIYNDLLKNGYIKTNDLGKVLVSQKHIVLFESEEDFELKEFLKRNGYSYNFLSMEDIGRTKIYTQENHPIIYNFDDKFQQFFYIFSDIRREIIAHEEKKDSITLFIKDDNDLYYVNFFSKLFDIPVLTKMKLPMISDNSVSKAVATFFKNKNFELPEDIESNQSIEVLKKIIEDYKLKDINDFDFAYPSLMEILSSKTYEHIYNDCGVGLTNEIFFDSKFDEDHIVYVTDFEFNQFYKEFDDNNILSDAELEKIGVNPSYVKTRMDRNLKLNFISYHRFGFLSRVLLHLKDKIYSSQFETEMGWKSVKPKEKHNTNGCYTTKALDFINAYYKDSGHYKPDEKYKNYNHDFSGIDKVEKKDQYYATEFDTLFDCPYKYYLDKVVNLAKYDCDSDFVARNRGVLIHKIFEDIYTKDYTSFDEAYTDSFNKGIEEYKKNSPDKTISLEEEIYIEFIRKWLKDVVKTVLKHKENANIVGENHEEPIQFTLPTSDIKLCGRIDKIIHTESPSGTRYYTIVDYKTGKSGTFDLTHCFLGGSLQLPIYEMALEDKKNMHLTSNQTEDYGGFAIQHLYYSNVPVTDNKYSEEAILDKIRMKGICFCDNDYFESFDNSAFKVYKNGNVKINAESEYLDTRSKFSTDKDNSIIYENTMTGFEYTYKDFRNDVIKAIERAVKKIENKEFKIAPVKTSNGYGSKESCRFCDFKDICYHTKKDVNNVCEKISRHFGEEVGAFIDDDEEDE